MPASRLFASLAPLALLCAGLGASSAVAAETVHLTLSANGDVIPGDSLQTNLGRANTIECVLFRTACARPPARRAWRSGG